MPRSAGRPAARHHHFLILLLALLTLALVALVPSDASARPARRGRGGSGGGNGGGGNSEARAAACPLAAATPKATVLKGSGNAGNAGYSASQAVAFVTNQPEPRVLDHLTTTFDCIDSR
jgi:hypothetical protein